MYLWYYWSIESGGISLHNFDGYLNFCEKAILLRMPKMESTIRKLVYVYLYYTSYV